MQTATWVVIGIFLAFALAELAWTRFFSKPGQTIDDVLVEGIGSPVLLLLTQPAIIVAVGLLMGWLVPGQRDVLAHLPWPAAVALFLLFDDMTQYWWHRTSHAVPWLYNLHRAHHDGRYMSVRIVYRNNILYYAMMPGLWFDGALIYLGLGWVYAGYVIVKQAVIIGAHCDVAWDRPLYRIKALSPLMWLVERTISTPSTHHAHHGRHASDPATHYKGNYGNLLFFWDVLFGTAKITRSYPENYGVENLPPAHAGRQLLWPIIR
ncbi:MAG: sterol desaturase family protein [Proteobacteria bacterium]|nr:sterol desaturase family protein [Pseudomonadota bacterium]